MSHKDYLQSKFGKPKRKRHGYFFTCETCGREFYVTPSRLLGLQKRGFTVRFCSRPCHFKAMYGAGNPRWGHKLTDEEKAKRHSSPRYRDFNNVQDNPNYKRFGETPHKNSTMKRWRKHLMKKHGSTCQRCGYKKYSQVIELHHRDCNRKNMIESNLELLCPTCHEETHYLAGTGKYAKYGNGKSHGQM